VEPRSEVTGNRLGEGRRQFVAPAVVHPLFRGVDRCTVPEVVPHQALLNGSQPCDARTGQSVRGFGSEDIEEHLDVLAVTK
jgi:hypothetical protein